MTRHWHGKHTFSWFSVTSATGDVMIFPMFEQTKGFIRKPDTQPQLCLSPMHLFVHASPGPNCFQPLNPLLSHMSQVICPRDEEKIVFTSFGHLLINTKTSFKKNPILGFYILFILPLFSRGQAWNPVFLLLYQNSEFSAIILRVDSVKSCALNIPGTHISAGSDGKFIAS